MSFKDLNLENSYSSDIDNVLFDFYIPVLKEAVEYYRLAGFFSSSSLAVAAKGIVHLIKNNGKMNMVISPKLSEKDKNAILNYEKNIDVFIKEKFIEEVDKQKEKIVKKPIKALGWMLANNILELKVAIIYDREGNILNEKEIKSKGIFHQKVGILYDENDNAISFSGSINESANAWLNNVEEFKVFKGWVESEEKFFKKDLEKFKRFWNGESFRIKTMEVPQAVENKLIEISPNNIEDIDWDTFNSIFPKKEKKPKNNIELFEHQKEAVNKWLKEGKKGLFSMATGTGKTYCALGCLREVNKNLNKWICIVAAPQSHLLDQWEREIENFGINYEKIIRADSTIYNYKEKLANSLMDINLGYHDNLIISTTHATLSSKDFREIIKNNKDDNKIFLIADEVHGLGANQSKKGLISEYDYRLGLSATPKRWFDEIGTRAIYKYFNDEIYEFGLNKALTEINPATGRTYLTPYKYIPKVVKLKEDELKEYYDKTKEYLKKLRYADDEDEEEEFYRKIKLINRSRIVKNATNKYDKLEEILNNIGNQINNTILFCDPGQIDTVMSILRDRNIIAHKFTQEEGTKAVNKYGGITERDYLIKKFSEGTYQILVAIRCLDEGVDVPKAENAIIMSSSTNPRQYIQRIGRVIRRSENKREAKIYDFIVAPSASKLPSALEKIEKRIFKKEFDRAKEIAENATNNAEALNKLYKINY